MLRKKAPSRKRCKTFVKKFLKKPQDWCWKIPAIKALRKFGAKASSNGVPQSYYIKLKDAKDIVEEVANEIQYEELKRNIKVPSRKEVTEQILHSFHCHKQYSWTIDNYVLNIQSVYRAWDYKDYAIKSTPKILHSNNLYKRIKKLGKIHQLEFKEK